MQIYRRPFQLLLVVLTFHFASAQNETMTRELSLDGNWEIIFDHENTGKDGRWFESSLFEKQTSKKDIAVPSAWELIEEDYEGVAFYKKTFEVPSDWEDKVIRLQFGAVNYLSEVWLNDEVVGYHEGGFTPFEFRVDEMIRTGEKNVLTMRVVGPIILSENEIDGIRKMETPQWRGGISGGIWQSVNLVATNEVYVDDVFIQPDIHDNSATFSVKLDQTGIYKKSIEIDISIFESGATEKKVAEIHEVWNIHPGINDKSWILKIPNTQYWSPDKPQLYIASIIIKSDDQPSDQWSEKFGMRELTIKDKDFYLNGERIYIKATFFEGLYPNGIAYPDSEEMARKEIRLAKQAGFNMIRPWRRPPAPMWLDLADEMGVLVVGSPALECMRLPLSTPYLPARVENEIRQAVLRDRNRACVVQWELFNELHRPVLNQLMRPMAMVTRQLDPTRLILDESGGWAFGANMYLPNEFEPTKFNDIHNYPGPFINNSLYDGYLTIGMTDEEKKAANMSVNTPGKNVVPGLMSFVSELGYGSLPDLVDVNKRFEEEGNPLTPAYRYHHRLAEEQKQMLEESGFGDMYPDMQQFYVDQQRIHGTANKRMIEAVRSNPAVDGYCIHALSAGDWILGAGLIDLWRNPKTYAYEATKAANQPRILSIRAFPRNVFADKGTSIEITGINELESISASLNVQILSEAGNEVLSQRMEIDLKSGVSNLFEIKPDTKLWDGAYRINAEIISGDKTILAENSLDIDVFTDQDLKSPDQTITILDEQGKLSAFLNSKGIKTSKFSSKTKRSSPVFVASLNEGTEELFDFAKKGGTVFFINGISKNQADSLTKFPFSTKAHPAQGLWTCIPHLVKDHPIFDGLPSNAMMRNTYENVWPKVTLRNIQGEEVGRVNNIVASVGFDWFSEGHKMHYSGPGDSWWGSDMAEISLGSGAFVISQLRIIENLGKDPVAEILLFNMIRYAYENEK